MRCADIEVPNLPVDVNSWLRSACYPRRTFYPLSDGPSMRNHRITKAWFPTCSTCRCRSQARLCFCTLRLISKQPERTFARLLNCNGGARRFAQAVWKSAVECKSISELDCDTYKWSRWETRL